MFYTANPFDRADQIRKDEAKTGAFWSSEGARLIPYYRGKLLTSTPQSASGQNQTGPHAVTLPTKNLPEVSSDRIFLGFYKEIPYFGLDFSSLEEIDELSLPPGSEFLDLRIVGPLLSADDGAMLAYTKAMMHWQQQTPHCSLCGHRNSSSSSGHVRVCTNDTCSNMTFPRTDPAVIMLVVRPEESGNPERCLLGRNPQWPPGVYSTLAGFVEPGETLETAVSREVFEESGVLTTDVTYVTSQPWPFPQSIMLGFKARALSTEITLDPAELGDANWFSRDELAQFGNWGDDNYDLQLPRPDSIARFLINSWLDS